MPEFLLGIDVGTSGSKALLMSTTGNVRAVATSPYELLTPKPQWSEQNPNDWWTGTINSIRAVLAEANATGADVAAIGLTGQMHGLVTLDAQNEIIRPAILWNDQRTGAQCDEIHRRIGYDEVLRVTGKPALTGFTAPKVLWLQEHEPENWSSVSKMMLPKDYVRFRMSGTIATDVADASGTSVFDVNARTWAEQLIDALGISSGSLPEVFESQIVCAAVDSECARATGLLEGTPIVAGAGDQAAEAVGCGIVEPGSISVTIGTSGVVFAATPEVRIDPDGRMHAYCHAVPRMWHVMGVMLSAGGSMQWLRDTLCSEEVREAEAKGVSVYKLMTNRAAEIEPGSEGLLFLPYLTGERTPHADPNARGVFFGLTRRHTKSHLIRAVMEGVTFGLRDLLDLTKNLNVPIESIRVSGGGARSTLWKHMLADVFDQSVSTVNATQGAAYGAAVLAAVGAGVFSNVKKACASIVQETSVTDPSQTIDRYDAMYSLYRDLYPVASPLFNRLAKLE